MTSLTISFIIERTDQSDKLSFWLINTTTFLLSN